MDKHTGIQAMHPLPDKDLALQLLSNDEIIFKTNYMNIQDKWTDAMGTINLNSDNDKEYTELNNSKSDPSDVTNLEKYETQLHMFSSHPCIVGYVQE